MENHINWLLLSNDNMLHSEAQSIEALRVLLSEKGYTPWGTVAKTVYREDPKTSEPIRIKDITNALRVYVKTSDLERHVSDVAIVDYKYNGVLIASLPADLNQTSQSIMDLAEKIHKTYSEGVFVGCFGSVFGAGFGLVGGLLSGGIAGSLIEYMAAHVTGDPYAMMGLSEVLSGVGSVLGAIGGSVLMYKAASASALKELKENYNFKTGPAAVEYLKAQ